MDPDLRIAYLESADGAHLSPGTPQTVDPATGAPLYVRYDMAALRATAQRDAGSPWRYADVLPAVPPVTLGEGWTPLLRSRRFPGLHLKDEGANPTGCQSARGFALATAMARYYGARHVALAADNEEAVSFAAYAAAAGLTAHLFLPTTVLPAVYTEAVLYGAEVHLVPGSLANCTHALKEQNSSWLDLSPFQEPYRLEGEKTLGYELCEQLNWQFPEAILYPGSPLGLQALHKAFDELDQLGWTPPGSPRPTLHHILPNPETLAITLDFARHEGLLLSPAGAAAAATYTQLLRTGELTPATRTVLINPSTALRHADRIADSIPLRRPFNLPTSMPVGGIITPV